MQRIKGQMEGMRQQIDEQMKNMPPERRQQMEQMMKARGLPPAGAKPRERDLQFQSLGEKKTVSGYACEMYRVLDGAAPVEEDCLSPWGSGMVSKAELEPFRKLAEAMSDMIGMGRGGDLHEMAKFPGFPVTRKHLGPDGQATSEEKVTSFKRGAVAQDLFTVPAGYRKTDLPVPGMGGGMGGRRPGPPQ
jgi:hypothetical protein